MNCFDQPALAQKLSCFVHSAPIQPDAASQSLVWIIAFPLIGALVCGVLGKSLGRANTGLIACMSVATSLVLSVLVAWVLNDHTLTTMNPFAIEPSTYSIAHDYATWFKVGDFQVHFGL